MERTFESESVPVAIESWVDYLVVGQDEIVWFSAVEDDPDNDGPPSWTMPNANIVAYGRGPGLQSDQELLADAVKDRAAATLELPQTRYRCFLVEGRQTVIDDPNLTGFFPVQWVGSSYEHSPIADIRGYDLFRMPTAGYLFLVVQRADGRAEIECVIRPQDVPAGSTMTDAVDVAMEAVGLEILANPL